MKSLTLDRLLQSQGFGTRAYCRELIESGEFSLDGEIVRDPRLKVDPKAHAFTVFSEPLDYREFVYIALNKPLGYECSRNPTRHLGVLNLLPENLRWREVQPVGRLDQDTTGLLLFSDDGQFIHQMSSPKHHVQKVYRVTTDRIIDKDFIALLLSGVQLNDEPTPIQAIQAQAIDEKRLDLVIAEGKYHQVRRMIAAAGAHCAALERIAIGPLKLETLGLSSGEWRYLSDEECDSLRP